MRILLVSSLYPGPADPDFGTFVAGLERALSDEGHDIRRAVVDRRGGSPLKHVGLLRDAVAGATAFRPDVVYAHYLVPAGLAGAVAAAAAGAPLVVTAHGRDVRNIGAVRGVGALTRLVLARAAVVVAVSEYLRRELVARVPAVRGKVEGVSAGVDMERFRPRDPGAAREAVGWKGEEPFLLCVGGLDERKNVVRLAEAFAMLGRGSLAFVGDGPARAALEGRPRIRVVGRIPHERVPEWMGACDVLCQPSLVEPFGIALLEAMAGARSVVATSVGGPPEFVPPEAGALVDPTDVGSIRDGLVAAEALPRPNEAARRAAAKHDVRVEARRISSLLERAAERGPAQ